MSLVTVPTDVFQAVADPTRRALLGLLRNSERSVSDLLQAFDVSQPAISQHLRVLREAGLVEVRRAGRQRLYRLRAERFASIYNWAAQYKQVVDPSGHVWGLARPREPAAAPKSAGGGRRKKPPRGSRRARSGKVQDESNHGG
jgi:DNA-binding transcriptional ArsR family regulator